MRLCYAYICVFILKVVLKTEIVIDVCWTSYKSMITVIGVPQSIPCCVPSNLVILLSLNYSFCLPLQKALQRLRRRMETLKKHHSTCEARFEKEIINPEAQVCQLFRMRILGMVESLSYPIA